MIVVNFDPVDKNIFTLVDRTIVVNFGSPEVPTPTIPADYGFAMGDEETDIVASVTALFTDIIARSQTITEVVFKLPVVVPVGGTTTFDIKINGTSIFSTLPTIDSGQASTIGASIPAVLSTTQMLKGDKIEAFLTIAASTTVGQGPKCTILGNYI